MAQKLIISLLVLSCLVAIVFSQGGGGNGGGGNGGGGKGNNCNGGNCNGGGGGKKCKPNIKSWCCKGQGGCNGGGDDSVGAATYKKYMNQCDNQDKQKMKNCFAKVYGGANTGPSGQYCEKPQSYYNNKQQQFYACCGGIKKWQQSCCQ